MAENDPSSAFRRSKSMLSTSSPLSLRVSLKTLGNSCLSSFLRCSLMLSEAPFIVVSSWVMINARILSANLLGLVGVLGHCPEGLLAPVQLLQLPDKGLGVIQALIVGLLLVQLQQRMKVVSAVVIGFAAATVEQIGQ